VLARQIAAGDTPIEGASAPVEARVRAAYGRAYYTLFLAVRSTIAARHAVPERRLEHGKLYTHLQSPRADARVRGVGKQLQHLYDLRRRADYDLAPDATWRNVHSADLAAQQAIHLAAIVATLDFGSVIDLLR
jgi:hypothetical protein